ncbi:MAG TPA: hypothetical protein VNX68_07085, partial [Nitrosopumilaceae archaeon]|nr:hypothetical protein [Nitrosopumilaceae archaeon]
MVNENKFSLEQTQKNSWIFEIRILKEILNDLEGEILFEFSIPRMGKRVDVILIIRNVIFVFEFKVGEKEFFSSSVDQVWDYALDLKNFHETSHKPLIARILIATNSKNVLSFIGTTKHNDNILIPIKTNSALLRKVIEDVLQFADGDLIDYKNWESGRYSPTPTIIEAALALYNNHSVNDITRKDADAVNLS